jgi:hypothetical protein
MGKQKSNTCMHKWKENITKDVNGMCSHIKLRADFAPNYIWVDLVKKAKGFRLSYLFSNIVILIQGQHHIKALGLPSYH